MDMIGAVIRETVLEQGPRAFYHSESFLFDILLHPPGLLIFVS